jgi:hypothetical protein
MIEWTMKIKRNPISRMKLTWHTVVRSQSIERTSNLTSLYSCKNLNKYNLISSTIYKPRLLMEAKIAGH